ncbi:MAG: hypothetical protein RSF83_10520 [Hungatella sp.]
MEYQMITISRQYGSGGSSKNMEKRHINSVAILIFLSYTSFH